MCKTGIFHAWLMHASGMLIHASETCTLPIPVKRPKCWCVSCKHTVMK